MESVYTVGSRISGGSSSSQNSQDHSNLLVNVEVHTVDAENATLAVPSCPDTSTSSLSLPNYKNHSNKNLRKQKRRKLIHQQKALIQQVSVVITETTDSEAQYSQCTTLPPPLLQTATYPSHSITNMAANSRHWQAGSNAQPMNIGAPISPTQASPTEEPLKTLVRTPSGRYVLQSDQLYQPSSFGYRPPSEGHAKSPNHHMVDHREKYEEAEQQQRMEVEPDSPQPAVLYKPKTFGYLNTYNLPDVVGQTTTSAGVSGDLGYERNASLQSNELDTSLPNGGGELSKAKMKRKRSRSKSKSAERLDDADNAKTENLTTLITFGPGSTFVQDTVSTSTVELRPQTVEVAVIPAKKERMTPRKVKRKKRSKSSDNMLDDSTASDVLSKSLPDLGDHQGSQSDLQMEGKCRSVGASEEDLSSRKLKSKKKKKSSQGDTSPRSKSVSSLDPNLATPPLARSSGVMETDVDDLIANGGTGSIGKGEGEPEYVTAQEVRAKKTEKKEKEKAKGKKEAKADAWKSLPSLLQETDIDAMIAAASMELFDKTINSDVTTAMENSTDPTLSLPKKKKKKKATTEKDVLSKSLPLLGNEDFETPTDAGVTNANPVDETSEDKKKKGKVKKKQKTSDGTDDIQNEPQQEGEGTIDHKITTGNKPKKKKKPKEPLGTQNLSMPAVDAYSPLYNTPEEVILTPVAESSYRDPTEHIPDQITAIPSEVQDLVKDAEQTDFTEDIHQAVSHTVQPSDETPSKKKKTKKKKSESSDKNVLSIDPGNEPDESLQRQPPEEIFAMETNIDVDLPLAPVSVDERPEVSLNDKVKKKKKRLKSDKTAEPDISQMPTVISDFGLPEGGTNNNVIMQEPGNTGVYSMETDIDGDLPQYVMRKDNINGPQIAIDSEVPMETQFETFKMPVTDFQMGIINTDKEPPKQECPESQISVDSQAIRQDMAENSPVQFSSTALDSDPVEVANNALTTEGIVPTELGVSLKGKKKKKSSSVGEDDGQRAEVSKSVKVKKRTSGEKKKKSSKSTPCLVDELAKQDQVTLDDLRLIGDKIGGERFEGDNLGETLITGDEESKESPIKKPKKVKGEKTKKSKSKENLLSSSLPFTDSPDQQEISSDINPDCVQTVQADVLMPFSQDGSNLSDLPQALDMAGDQIRFSGTGQNTLQQNDESLQVFHDVTESSLQTPLKVKKKKVKPKSEGDAIGEESGTFSPKTKPKKGKESKGKTKKKVIGDPELNLPEVSLNGGSVEMANPGERTLEKVRKKKKSGTEKKKKSAKSTPCLLEEVEMEGKLNFSDFMPKEIQVNPTEDMRNSETSKPAGPSDSTVLSNEVTEIPVQDVIPKTKDKVKKKRKDGAEKKKKSSKSTPCLVEEFNTESSLDFLAVKQQLLKVGDPEPKSSDTVVSGGFEETLMTVDDTVISPQEQDMVDITSTSNTNQVLEKVEKVKKKRKSSAERKKKSSKSTPCLVDELDNEMTLGFSSVIPKTEKPKMDDMEPFSSLIPKTEKPKMDEMEPFDMMANSQVTMQEGAEIFSQESIDLNKEESEHAMEVDAKDDVKVKKKRKSSADRKKKSSKSTPSLVDELNKEMTVDFSSVIPKSEKPKMDDMEPFDLTGNSQMNMPESAESFVQKLDDMKNDDLIPVETKDNEKVKKKRKSSADRKKKSSKSTPSLVDQLNKEMTVDFSSVIPKSEKPKMDDMEPFDMMGNYGVTMPNTLAQVSNNLENQDSVHVMEVDAKDRGKVKKKRKYSTEKKKKSSKSTPCLIEELSQEGRLEFPEIVPKIAASVEMKPVEMPDPSDVPLPTDSILDASVTLENEDNEKDAAEKDGDKLKEKAKKKRKSSAERKKKSSKSTPCLIDELDSQNTFTFSDIIPRSSAKPRNEEIKVLDMPDRPDILVPDNTEDGLIGSLLQADTQESEAVIAEDNASPEKVTKEKKKRKSSAERKKSSKSTPSLIDEVMAENRIDFGAEFLQKPIKPETPDMPDPLSIGNNGEIEAPVFELSTETKPEEQTLKTPKVKKTKKEKDSVSESMPFIEGSDLVPPTASTNKVDSLKKKKKKKSKTASEDSMGDDRDILQENREEHANVDENNELFNPLQRASGDQKLDEVFMEMENLLLDSVEGDGKPKRPKKKTRSTAEIFEDIIPKKPRSPDKTSVSDQFLQNIAGLEPATSLPPNLASQEPATVMTPDKYTAFSRAENLVQTSTPYRGDGLQIDDTTNKVDTMDIKSQPFNTDALETGNKPDDAAVEEARETPKAKKRSKASSKQKPQDDHIKKKKKKSRSSENIVDTVESNTGIFNVETKELKVDESLDHEHVILPESKPFDVTLSPVQQQGPLDIEPDATESMHQDSSANLLDMPHDDIEISTMHVTSGPADTSLPPSQDTESESQEVLTSTPKRLNSSTVEDMLDMSTEQRQEVGPSDNHVDAVTVNDVATDEAMNTDMNSVETNGANTPVPKAETKIKKSKKKKIVNSEVDEADSTSSKKRKKKSKTSSKEQTMPSESITVEANLQPFTTESQTQEHIADIQPQTGGFVPQDPAGMPDLVFANDGKTETVIKPETPDILQDDDITHGFGVKEDHIYGLEADLVNGIERMDNVQIVEIPTRSVEKPIICENEIETVTDEPDLQVFDKIPTVPSNRLSLGDSILEKSIFMEDPDIGEANLLDDSRVLEQKEVVEEYIDKPMDSENSSQPVLNDNIDTVEGTSEMVLDSSITDKAKVPKKEKTKDKSKTKKKQKSKEILAEKEFDEVHNAENVQESGEKPNFGEISTDLIIEEIERKPRKTRPKGQKSKSMENILQDVNRNRIVEEFLQNQTIDIMNADQSKSFEADFELDSPRGEEPTVKTKKPKKSKVKSEKKAEPTEASSKAEEEEEVSKKKPAKKAKEKMTPRQMKKKAKQKKLERQTSGGGGGDDNKSVASSEPESASQVGSPTSTEAGDVWKSQAVMERSFAASEVSFHTGVSSIHDIGNVMDIDDLMPKSNQPEVEPVLKLDEDQVGQEVIEVEELSKEAVDDAVVKTDANDPLKNNDNVLKDKEDIDSAKDAILDSVPRIEPIEEQMKEDVQESVPKKKKDKKDKVKKEKDGGKVKKEKKKKDKKIKKTKSEGDHQLPEQPGSQKTEIATMVPEQKPDEKVWEFLGQKLSHVCENLLQEGKTQPPPGGDLFNDSFGSTGSADSEEQYTEIKSIVSGDFLDISDVESDSEDDLNRSVDLLGSTDYLEDLDSHKRTKSEANLTKTYTGERDTEKAKSAIDLTQHSLSETKQKKVDNTFNRNASRSFNILCPDTSEDIPYADSSDDSQADTPLKKKQESEEFQSPLRTNAELRRRQLIGVARLAKSRPNIYSMAAKKPDSVDNKLKTHSKSLGDVSKLSKPSRPASRYEWRPIVRSYHKKTESTPDTSVKRGILKVSTSLTRTTDTQKTITESHEAPSKTMSEKSNTHIERMTIIESGATPKGILSTNNRKATSEPNVNIPEAEVHESGETLTFKLTEQKKPGSGQTAIEKYVDGIVESSIQQYKEELSREELADRAAGNVIKDIETSVINILNEGENRRPAGSIEGASDMSTIKADLARELKATSTSPEVSGQKTKEMGAEQTRKVDRELDETKKTTELGEDQVKEVEDDDSDEETESSDDDSSSTGSDDSGFLIQGISVVNDDHISALFARKMQRLDNLAKGIDTSLDHIKDQDTSSSEEEDDEDDDDDEEDDYVQAEDTNPDMQSDSVSDQANGDGQNEAQSQLQELETRLLKLERRFDMTGKKGEVTPEDTAEGHDPRSPERQEKAPTKHQGKSTEDVESPIDSPREVILRQGRYQDSSLAENSEDVLADPEEVETDGTSTASCDTVIQVLDQQLDSSSDSEGEEEEGGGLMVEDASLIDHSVTPTPENSGPLLTLDSPKSSSEFNENQQQSSELVTLESACISQVTEQSLLIPPTGAQIVPSQLSVTGNQPNISNCQLPVTYSIETEPDLHLDKFENISSDILERHRSTSHTDAFLPNDALYETPEVFDPSAIGVSAHKTRVQSQSNSKNVVGKPDSSPELTGLVISETGKFEPTGFLEPAWENLYNIKEETDQEPTIAEERLLLEYTPNPGEEIGGTQQGKPILTTDIDNFQLSDEDEQVESEENSSDKQEVIREKQAVSESGTLDESLKDDADEESDEGEEDGEEEEQSESGESETDEESEQDSDDSSSESVKRLQRYTLNALIDSSDEEGAELSDSTESTDSSEEVEACISEGTQYRYYQDNFEDAEEDSEEDEQILAMFRALQAQRGLQTIPEDPEMEELESEENGIESEENESESEEEDEEEGESESEKEDKEDGEKRESESEEEESKTKEGKDLTQQFADADVEHSTAPSDPMDEPEYPRSRDDEGGNVMGEMSLHEYTAESGVIRRRYSDRQSPVVVAESPPIFQSPPTPADSPSPPTSPLRPTRPAPPAPSNHGDKDNKPEDVRPRVQRSGLQSGVESDVKEQGSTPTGDTRGQTEADRGQMSAQGSDRGQSSADGRGRDVADTLFIEKALMESFFTNLGSFLFLLFAVIVFWLIDPWMMRDNF